MKRTSLLVALVAVFFSFPVVAQITSGIVSNQDGAVYSLEADGKIWRNNVIFAELPEKYLGESGHLILDEATTENTTCSLMGVVFKSPASACYIVGWLGFASQPVFEASNEGRPTVSAGFPTPDAKGSVCWNPPAGKTNVRVIELVNGVRTARCQSSFTIDEPVSSIKLERRK